MVRPEWECWAWEGGYQLDCMDGGTRFDWAREWGLMEVFGLDRSELDLDWVWWREGVGLGLGLDGNQGFDQGRIGFRLGFGPALRTLNTS